MNEDKIIQEVMTLKDTVGQIQETLATEMIKRSDYDKHTGLLESIVTITKKTNEDHVFSVEWLKRLQNQVDVQEEAIRKIKLQLHLA